MAGGGKMKTIASWISWNLPRSLPRIASWLSSGLVRSS